MNRFDDKRPLFAGTFLKSLISSPINKYKNDLGFELDISYILPNLIVCSYPVVKYPKLIYRNNLMDLIEFMNVNHGPKNWKLYNFKVEKSVLDYSDKEFYYLTSKHTNTLDPLNYQTMENVASTVHDFSGKFPKRIGWLDHSSPPFYLLQEIIDDIHRYLMRNDKNVAILHCKMGKGRCGTISVAYMMKYSHYSVEDSCRNFMNSRFKPGVSKGVTIRSQLRYLKYHELFLSLDAAAQKEVLRFNKHRYEILSIHFVSPFFELLPKSYCPKIKFKCYNKNRDGLIEMLNFNINDLLSRNINHSENAIIEYNDDIKLEFGILLIDSKITKIVGKEVVYAKCWLNFYLEFMRFIEKEDSHCEDKRNYQINLSWDKLDGPMGGPYKGIKVFDTVQIVVRKL
ncbi:hypothetical protein KAFR_0J02170 [Kazachstania africana CBS 2517]|uniref:phosphatidylinositol-3,4,5-trisphosphate 3-phosphatase n=1 Tax=Kazachstania africana (strain ATCC 22294 / BCRC 22015 / CBS 2517 / CECT 1963 / NBRC 1671 / NRRL Y-8276) TaxID=1071382 RepID=H2B0Y1_KAZAF|nr:hypothetical protein KAFR_0J02170 [Kazachstania africana CBS 2517]CCF60281.1 hypothetical protein KAFR_0J02170 [Kazachstania africana CBS 2517]